MTFYSLYVTLLRGGQLPGWSLLGLSLVERQLLVGREVKLLNKATVSHTNYQPSQNRNFSCNLGLLLIDTVHSHNERTDKFGSYQNSTKEKFSLGKALVIVKNCGFGFRN